MWDGDPDLVRELCADSMYLERRKEADDRVGNAGADGGYRIAFRGLGADKPVKAPSDALDSRTGRKLFHALRGRRAEALAAGSSDWVVHPVGGGYPADEAYFLGCILHFVDVTLRGHSELDDSEFGEWLTIRRGQLADGELVYVAHQLDYCGRALS